MSEPVKQEILRVENLHVTIKDDSNQGGIKEIIHGLNLVIKAGEIHAFMGPNGSGKSTLSNTIMGHPFYRVTSGRIFFRGEDITDLPPHERARKGLFLSFQYPVALPGVSLTNFLRTAVTAVHGEMPVKEFRLRYMDNLKKLKIDPSFTSRYVNDGFSGGEKKRFEILQMAMLQPHLAILDEIDSGLDIDAMNVVSEGINTLGRDEMAVLMITHYQRILKAVKPEFVHIFANGRLLRSGGIELAERLEQEGYDWILQETAGTH